MLRSSTQSLSIRSGDRCGARGIKLHGLQFAPEPRVVQLSDLPDGVALALVSHPELIVEQLDSTSGGGAPSPLMATTDETPPSRPASRPSKRGKRK